MIGLLSVTASAIDCPKHAAMTGGTALPTCFFLSLAEFLGLRVDVGGIAGNLAVVMLIYLIGGCLFVGIVHRRRG